MSDTVIERVPERQPCGCERLFFRGVYEDTIEWEEIERFSPCEIYRQLVEREKSSEKKLVSAHWTYGENSPEWHRANMRHMDVLEQLEKHSEY